MSFWFGLIGIFLLVAFLFGAVGWTIATIGGVLLWISVARFWSRYKAASNALLAKYTFDGLPEPDKQLVVHEAARIMTGAKFPAQDPKGTLERSSPAERFGFYALAMANLSMKPKIGEGWYDVRNPYAQIIGAHREIATVRYQLRGKYKVDVDLEST